MEVKAVRDPNVAGRVNLYGVRIAYADGLNAPKAGQPDAAGNASAPRYSCSVLLPQSAAAAVTEVQQVMWALAVGKWADKAQVTWQALAASNKLALRDGATKADQAGFLGCMFISLAAKPEAPPKLLSQYVDGNGRVVELPRPQNVIYSGCYVNAQIDFWVQDNAYGKRINAEVKLVQFAADGESFGGGGASADTSVFAQGLQQAPAGFAPAPQAPTMPGFAAPQAPTMPGFAAPQAPTMPGFAAPQAPTMPPGFDQTPVPWAQ